jgi:hypothetical protein
MTEPDQHADLVDYSLFYVGFVFVAVFLLALGPGLTVAALQGVVILLVYSLHDSQVAALIRVILDGQPPIVALDLLYGLQAGEKVFIVVGTHAIVSSLDSCLGRPSVSVAALSGGFY